MTTETMNYILTDLQQRLNLQSPALMLDRARVDKEARTVTAGKAVTANENFFNGHFPGNPIMPGVLQVAAMAQAGELLARHLFPQAEKTFWRLTRLEKVKFRRPVTPGDRLIISGRLLQQESETTATFAATADIDGQTASQATITLESTEADLRRTHRREPETAPFVKLPGFEPVEEQTFPVTRIAEVLPHRYPFLLLDRILRLDPGQQRVLALKNISGNEPFFAGSSAPVTPLFLLAEMAAQAGCFLALQMEENRHKIGYFMAIDRAVSLIPAMPGDQLIFDSRMIGKGRYGRGESDIYIGDQKAAEIAIKFILVEQDKEKQGQ